MKKKKYIQRVLRIAGAILFLPLLALMLIWLNEWRPAAQETIYFDTSGQPLPDTITILTWNTGYAGLGKEMDFFMDGGKKTRASSQQTEENLLKITEFLQSCDADIILLQEVDLYSRRSYRSNQFNTYRTALPHYHSYFAPNYISVFVPAPWYNPMGEVESGVAVFSKIKPQEVVRYQYPSKFSLPVRLFNLKRCLLGAKYMTAGGEALWIGNTHNTAYDTGGMRTTEMEWLRSHLTGLYRAGGKNITGGDWNQNPPGYIPTPAEVNDLYFSPTQIEAEFFPEGWTFAYDGGTPSMRYLNEPLTESTTVSIIDFFLASPGVRCLEVRTIDLGFENSDHNPVTATFVLSE